MIGVLSTLDWLALIWFIVCWVGYAAFAYFKTLRHDSLAYSLSEVRGIWMQRAVARDVRIADVTALGILQRNVTFFASTTILILAGLLTVLGSSDQAVKLANSLPFAVQNSMAQWEIKLLLLIFIFVYAFFKFAWSVRQYNFAIILLGAAPPIDAEKNEIDLFTLQAKKILSLASNSFALGLRGYSFALAALSWFIQPWLFMLCSFWIILVLYRRDFHSRSLQAVRSVVAGNLAGKK